MEVIKINVAKTAARAKQIELVTTGMVGASVRFSFGSEWNGLTRTAVFRAGKIAKDVVLTSDTALIPPEVLAAPASLFIGVYGSNSDGTLVIPTVMVQACFVLPGADPSGDESTDPTLSVWQQILSLIGPMDELGTEAKDSLVAAINEVIRIAGGDIDPEVIAGAVTEYLAANPIQEADPTVPAWAKQPTKPGYTAEEVGALDGKSVYYWNHNDGGTNDVFDIVLNYSCGVVTAGAGNPPTGMTFPAFVITGSVDRWYKNFSVIDNGGKFYQCVADLRTLEATVTPIYPSAEDVGALPNDTVIPTVPTKVSAFTNDSGYQTEAQVNALINTALAAIPNAAEVAY